MKRQDEDSKPNFDETAFGQVIISGLVVVIITVGVVWNLPSAALTRPLTPVLGPVAGSTGLQQGWGMFAPNPYRQRKSLEVRVTMADGEERLWEVKRGDRVIGSFVWTHWQQLASQAIDKPRVRARFASWIVREVTRPGESPVRVRMVARIENLAPPGDDTPQKVVVKTVYDRRLTGMP